MLHNVRLPLATGLLVGLLVGWLGPRPAQAVAYPPATVWGTLTLDGTPAPNGSVLHAAIGGGTLSPSRSRCWRSAVSHARSASLLTPRRATASCPWTRTLHTSLATPPASGS